MQISFDYDGTLTQPKILDLAKKFSIAGHRLYIITARHDIQNIDNPNNHWTNSIVEWNEKNHSLLETAKLLNAEIIFTNMNPKFEYMKGIHLHFDDSIFEVDSINELTKTIAVKV